MLIYTCIIFLSLPYYLFLLFFLVHPVFSREGKLSISGFLGFYSRYLDAFYHESSYDRLYGINNGLIWFHFVTFFPWYFLCVIFPNDIFNVGIECLRENWDLGRVRYSSYDKPQGPVRQTSGCVLLCLVESAAFV